MAQSDSADAALAWVREKGSARGYVNVLTGQRISRTVYDKRYGRLAKLGGISPQQQARQNAQRDREAQLKRPAPGRVVKPSKTASRIRPLKNKMGRYLSMPVDVALTDDPVQNLGQAIGQQSEYDAIVAGIMKNKNFDWVMLELHPKDSHPIPLKGPGGISYQVSKESLPTYEQLWEIAARDLQQNDSLQKNTYIKHIVFYLHTEKSKQIFDKERYVLKKKKPKTKPKAKRKTRRK